MTNRRELRTQFSMRALDMAEIFRGNYGGKVLGSPQGGGYSVDLSAPEGPSTGGGAQAVQHLRLVPVGGVSAAHPILTAGSVTQITMRVELRTYDHIAQIFAARTKGASLPFDRSAYDQFVAEAAAFFQGTGFTVIWEAPRVTDPAGTPAGERSTAQTQGPWKLLAIVALLGLVAFAILFYLRR